LQDVFAASIVRPKTGARRRSPTHTLRADVKNRRFAELGSRSSPDAEGRPRRGLQASAAKIDFRGGESY
jgi:hypothetical protein